MTKEKAIEGLKILAGDLLPEGYIFTSDDAKDREHARVMVKWLNDTETIPNLRHLEGGIYYGYAITMAERLLDFYIKYAPPENKQDCIKG